MIFRLVALIGVMFGFLAALTSSLIVYDENRKHGLRKVQLRSRVFGAAAVTFLVFVALSMVLGYIALQFAH